MVLSVVRQFGALHMRAQRTVGGYVKKLLHRAILNHGAIRWLLVNLIVELHMYGNGKNVMT